MDSDIARLWPLFVGMAVCALAALVLVRGLRRLREQDRRLPEGGLVTRSAAPLTKAGVFGRFIALDALGILLMLWGVLRYIELI